MRYSSKYVLGCCTIIVTASLLIWVVAWDTVNPGPDKALRTRAELQKWEFALQVVAVKDTNSIITIANITKTNSNVDACVRVVYAVVNDGMPRLAITDAWGSKIHLRIVDVNVPVSYAYKLWSDGPNQKVDNRADDIECSGHIILKMNSTRQP